MILMKWIDYLDIQTLALVVALVFFLQTLILVAFFLLVNEYDGIGLVSLGSTIYGSGFGVIILRYTLSDYYLGLIGGILSLIGAFFLLWGLTRFCGAKFNFPFFAVFTILMWFSALYCGLILKDINLRMVFVSLGLAVLLGSAAIYLFLSPAPGYKTAVILTGLPLFLYAIFLLIRMTAVLFSTTENSLLDEHWTQILFFLLVFIFGSLWSSGFILMITQRLRYELHQQARFDILTQRPNRLSMQERLEVAIAQIRRSGQSFSIFVIDIDYFKQVNDMYGHEVGDFVLREVAMRLWKTLRPQDSLGRWGGEEFLVILPDTDAQTALVIAERLRVTCMSTPFLAGDASIKVTISTGVAVCSHQDADLHLLLRTADRALYHAKNSGRNCVHLAESTSVPVISAPN